MIPDFYMRPLSDPASPPPRCRRSGPLDWPDAPHGSYLWAQRVGEQNQDDAIREVLDELIWKDVQRALEDQRARGPRRTSC